jgi:eukaryotic translation initiation factor 2C
MVTNYPQGKNVVLTDRTGPPNQARPTPPTTGQLTGPIWVSDGKTSGQGPKKYTEADFVSFGIKRTEEQQSFTTDDLKFEHGLRTDYGKNNDFNQERRIITNYVKVNQKPKSVYVYELHFVRVREPPAQDKVVKNKVEKGAIFEALKHRPGYASLRDRRDYATDYDVIWSTTPLFPNKADGTEAIPVEEPFFQVLHPFTGQAIQWIGVKIKRTKTIDAQANVRSFAGGRNGDVDDLTRGINAFMTQHARENATANGYESTAANRFFLTQGVHQHNLDGSQQNARALVALRGFTLSARPGSDEWYINLHTGASPFIVGGKFDDLFVRLRTMGLTLREVFKTFRNREVMINNPPSSSPLPRIITEIGNVQLQAKNTWDQFDAELRAQHRNMHTLPVNVGPTGPNAVRYDAGEMTVRGLHTFRGLLVPAQTTRMLEFACRLPVINKKYIEDAGFDMFGIQTTVGQSRIADFGLAVEKELLRIPARLLPPPRLNYQGATRTIPEAASWNLVNTQFFLAATSLKSVVMLDLGGRGLHRLATAMTKELKRLGMTEVSIEPSNLMIRCKPVPGENDLLNLFQKVRRDASAVFVILPEADFDLYSRIKRVADLRLGKHVVCATASKLQKLKGGFFDDMFYANIGMKFNLKGGGINHSIDPDHLKSIIQPGSTSASAACRTIIIGADVAHATGSARPGCPSIAAVVGSVDDNYLHYPGSTRLQLNRQESITDLKDMVKERLIDWAVKHQNTLPANMLMYRDGVSESQYDAVRDDEIPQLQGAFNDAYEFLKPGRSAKTNPPKFNLTFVVVGKRHNTRFFTDNKTQDNSFTSDLKNNETGPDVYPKSQEDEDQIFQQKIKKNGQVDKDKWTRMNHNLTPGFVVDKVITHPYREDFFLQSHMPLQGTGRSAHYFVMTNQMRLSSDVLQRITHATCYIYARATKGVSYCAPAYYADRLCDRGRAWLREHLMGQRFVQQKEKEDFNLFKQRALDEIDQGSYWRPLQSTELKYGQKRKNPWHKNLDDIMFYL